MIRAASRALDRRAQSQPRGPPPPTGSRTFGGLSLALPPPILRRRRSGGVPGLALRPLRVSAAPKRVDDLLRFLRQVGYVADEIDYGVVQVEQVPDRAPEGVFALALALQLRVWNVVNDAEARIIEVSGPLEP